MEKYQEVSQKPVGKIIWHNFLGGLAWGLGATVGLSVLFAIIGFIFRQIDFVPVFGDFLRNVTLYIDRTSPPLE